MLKLILLGEQRLVRDGVDVAAGGSRAVEILAYLALHPGRQVPRALLAGTFWPESADAQALTNLRRELHQLRRLPGVEGCLETTDGAIGFIPHRGLEADVQDHAESVRRAAELAASGPESVFLEQAERAVLSYAGDLMPGSYADWVMPLRYALRDSTTDLADQALEVALAVGELACAVGLARAWVAMQPLDEIGHRGLIRAHLAVGDHGTAMQAFHDCAGILARELGVCPALETRDLLGVLISSRGEASDRSPMPPSGREHPPGSERDLGLLRGYW